MDLLKGYSWPGNVRELKNVIESMLVIDAGKRIEPNIVKKYLKGFHDNGMNYLPATTRKTPEQAERELIYRALLEMRGDILDIKQLLLNGGITQANVHESGDLRGRVIEADVTPETEEKTDHPASLSDLERTAIAAALDRFKGNRRLASKQLKISERTLYRKIKEYHLESM
jgi:DNA-binding NtrC family response regulator